MAILRLPDGPVPVPWFVVGAVIGVGVGWTFARFWYVTLPTIAGWLGG